LPVLLNPGDTVNLRFIIIGQEKQANSTFTFDARIKDIKEVAVFDSSDLPNGNLLISIVDKILGGLVVLSSIFGLVLIFLGLRSLDPKSGVQMAEPKTFFTGLGLTLFILTLSLLLLSRDKLF
jgi:hypothetical protein